MLGDRFDGVLDVADDAKVLLTEPAANARSTTVHASSKSAKCVQINSMASCTEYLQQIVNKKSSINSTRKSSAWLDGGSIRKWMAHNCGKKNASDCNSPSAANSKKNSSMHCSMSVSVAVDAAEDALMDATESLLLPPPLPPPDEVMAWLGSACSSKSFIAVPMSPARRNACFFNSVSESVSSRLPNASSSCSRNSSNPIIPLLNCWHRPSKTGDTRWQASNSGNFITWSKDQLELSDGIQPCTFC
mmetsp:Transcript_23023/g.65254  ORF Transcript_23023/g.65254 Transcript_23023/m.65254 type:complete len:246 (+) Transcript_23023:1196-1933(+)